MGVEIRITGIGNTAHLADALGEAIGRVQREAPDVVQRAGTKYQSRAKFFVPVDTGGLRSSIAIDPGGALEVTVTAHAGFAGFVEYGTSRAAGQSFMGPAERSVTPEAVDEFRDLGTVTW